jgi:hypothetical protein
MIICVVQQLAVGAVANVRFARIKLNIEYSTAMRNSVIAVLGTLLLKVTDRFKEALMASSSQQ